MALRYRPVVSVAIAAAKRTAYRDPRYPLVRTLHSTRSLRQDVFHSQLENPSAAAVFNTIKTTPKVPQTLTEKIVQRYSVGLPEGKFVKSGDYVTIRPHHCMTHDNSFPVLTKLQKLMDQPKILDNKQIVMTLDHDVQNKSETNLKKYKYIEEFAKEQGVDFYPAGRGIGHQIMVEELYAFPETLVVASDSHSNMYGGIGALGTPVVRTDAASIWATSKTWWQIPPVASVRFTGVLPVGVTGKDVIVALCGLFSNDEVLNHAIEFTGSKEALESLPIDYRLTIANMTTEWGALTGLFPFDETLERWLRYKATEAAMFKNHNTEAGKQRITHEKVDQIVANRLKADKGAKYAKHLYLDLSTLVPYVSGPNSVKVATPLTQLESQNIKIDKAYLVSCTNARASDLAAAAKVFKDAAAKNGGKIPKIASGVKFYVAAASELEQEAAEEAGDWQAMLEAGAMPLPPSCAMCIGMGTGLLEPGEVGISASNRNFKGRMGSTAASAYLASPEVVATSALSGKICGTGVYEAPEGWSGVKLGEGDGIREEDRMLTAEEAIDKVLGQLGGMIESAEQLFGDQAPSSDSGVFVDVLPGFPERISGEIVFCDADNINTDGIYPGSMTYQDNVSQEDMAKACMQNYDPDFSHLAREGDILVSGFNFGTGSSREQAATAILAKKIPLVVAGSFGNIFSRNSINNALMGLEVPKLVQRLREEFSSKHHGQSGSDVTEPALNKESLDSPPPGKMESAQVLTRRTGWKLTWDVRKSQVEVEESGGKKWTVQVGELPVNVQEIIAKGGLEKWVKAQIAS